MEKSGLDGLSGVLRAELAPDGIDVAVIEPGYVNTGMRGKLRRDTEAVLGRLPGDAVARYGTGLRAATESIARHAEHGADPAVVARAVRHALTARRPRTRYPAGPGASRILLLARLLPDRALDRIIAGMLRG